MKRLPPAKRNQLIMVIAATIVLLCVVYFCLIRPQKEKNDSLAGEIHGKQDTLQKVKNSIKEADQISAKLNDISLQLGHAEDDVANGDVYAWIYDTIRRFKAKYQVDIPTIGQPNVSEVDLLAGLPYRQVKVSLSGTAYYHDLGKFVAEFENNFPHMRLVNLSIEPAGLPGSNAERLSFRVDVIALVKPNT